MVFELFGLKTGINLTLFGLKSGMVSRKLLTGMYERICRFIQMKTKLKE